MKRYLIKMKHVLLKDHLDSLQKTNIINFIKLHLNALKF